MAAAVATISLKLAAYLLTGSVGLLSDALESLINLATAGLVVLALWYAARPVDESHTYGHEKFEFFASGIQGALITAAGLGVAAVAVEHLRAPPLLRQLELGLLLGFIATVLNLAVARVLLGVAQRSDSIVLEAEGRHLMADVWTSVGVLAGLSIVRFTGVVWLDPLVGLTVAAFILRTGLSLLKRSYDGLMDRTLPADEVIVLRDVLTRLLPREATYHGLRTRRAGRRRFIEFHLLVPGRWSVARAHVLTQDVEHAISDELHGAQATVHIEPVEEPSSWADTPLLEHHLPRPPGAPPAG